MLLIGARLAYLQTAQHDWLTKRARAQQLDVEPQPAPRGLIRDRQGRELARIVDVDSFAETISLASHRRQHLDDGFTMRLCHAENQLCFGCKFWRQVSCGMRLHWHTQRLQHFRCFRRERGFVWLARRVEVEQSRAVRGLKLKGVYSTEEQKRHYPKGALAGHVLGFVGGEEKGREKGLAGVEQIYDAALTGESGRLVFDADAKRRAFESAGSEARDGRTLVLTIDETVQHIVERELAAAVSIARFRSSEAKDIWIGEPKP
jgi:cell division protein FtsI (penicillin-binding protein 3)